MNTKKTIQARVGYAIAMLVAVSFVALAGCGEDAPYGSTVTITRQAFMHSTDSSVPFTDWEDWRVSVSDAAGNPLNGVEVSLETLIGNGQNVTVNGGTGNAGDVLMSKITMGDFGYKIFRVSASNQATGFTLPFPDPVTATAGVGGGSLTNGAYSYIVTARDASPVPLETSAQFTATAVISNATTSADSVTVTWTAVPGATGYNIYGRTAGAEQLIGTALVSATSWVDLGGGVIGGAAPALGSQPAGIIANRVKAKIGASTGATTAVGDVDFSVH